MYISKRTNFSKLRTLKQQVAWYISFEILVNKVPTVVAGTYLSSSSEHKSQVLDSFEQWCASISDNKQMMVCGDFNIDMLRCDTHAKRLQNFNDDGGLRQLTNKPTRAEGTSITMIDLCVTNINSNKLKCSVLEEDQKHLQSAHQQNRIIMYCSNKILIKLRFYLYSCQIQYLLVLTFYIKIET